MKLSSELPDDEGTVFVTHVPGAPFQILGRRGPSGELFCGSLFNPPDGESLGDGLAAMQKAVGPVEVITGREAEQLIADMIKSGNRA